MRKIIFFLSFAAVVFALTACGTPAYNVEVYVSPKVKEKYQIRPSLEVDLIGISANKEEHFKNISVNDYFTPENALREGTNHATLHFSEESSAPKLMPKKDGIWDKFGEIEADKLCLMVNLPVLATSKQGGSAVGSGKEDGRKVFIPLKVNWFTSDTRIFEITPAGLTQLKNRPDYSNEKIQIEHTEEAK